jgi:hypothetical protein
VPQGSNIEPPSFLYFTASGIWRVNLNFVVFFLIKPLLIAVIIIINGVVKNLGGNSWVFSLQRVKRPDSALASCGSGLEVMNYRCFVNLCPPGERPGNYVIIETAR